MFIGTPPENVALTVVKKGWAKVCCCNWHHISTHEEQLQFALAVHKLYASTPGKRCAGLVAWPRSDS